MRSIACQRTTSSILIASLIAHASVAVSEDAPRLIKNTIGMSFCPIPDGSFKMGQPDVGVGGFEIPDEVRPHQVSVNSFYLGTTEVTESQFAAVLKTGDKHEGISGQMPRVNVSWFEAEKYCKLLTEVPAEKRANRRYRLPTEAEWEYACRSATSKPYKFTNDAEKIKQTGASGGRMLVGLKLKPVASFPPNSLGLYDMRGNVFEWCADWYSRDYYSKSPKADPKGPSDGEFKIFRGSDWVFSGDGCHLSRHPTEPWRKNPYIGFRIVCEVDKK
ncbi:MAG: SUMF1/EgtB/PvdO family nonheme iron enzyme [Planctomycetales bacterium]|nr:SUMF1/EgtB/PvdO family nonheme iron enzyme [Planctomycetales bacterium]